MQFDDELRARFGQLRDADGGDAPSVGTLVSRAPVDRRATTARRAAVAIVAMCVVAGGSVLARQRSHRPAPSVARWQSPTTSLVPTSGQSVLAPAPLLSSVLDGATTSTLWKKGD